MITKTFEAIRPLSLSDGGRAEYHESLGVGRVFYGQSHWPSRSYMIVQDCELHYQHRRETMEPRQIDPAFGNNGEACLCCGRIECICPRCPFCGEKGEQNCYLEGHKLEYSNEQLLGQSELRVTALRKAIEDEKAFQLTLGDGDIPKEKWEDCDRCLIKIRPPGLADHRCSSCGRLV